MDPALVLSALLKYCSRMLVKTAEASNGGSAMDVRRDMGGSAGLASVLDGVGAGTACGSDSTGSAAS